MKRLLNDQELFTRMLRDPEVRGRLADARSRARPPYDWEAEGDFLPAPDQDALTIADVILRGELPQCETDEKPFDLDAVREANPGLREWPLEEQFPGCPECGA